LTQYATDNKKKELPSKTWKKVIRADRRALKAGIFSSNLKITFSQVFGGNSFFHP
jgi:hypothetical protein